MQHTHRRPRTAGTVGGRTRKVGPMSSDRVEPGYCQCGCGERVGFWERTHASLDRTKGEPKRFAKGHRKPRPWLDRMVEKLDLTGSPDQCWGWTASLNAYGYAQFQRGKTMVRVHRVLYEELVGPVGDNLDLDHLCRNRACVNPAHLEPVSHGENCRRGAKARLDWDKVAEIRRRRKAKEPAKRIAADFGIHPGTVVNIACGLRWPESERPKEAKQ